MLILFLILHYTHFNYHIFTINNSKNISKLSNLQTHHTIVTAHVVCSLTTVVTNLFLTNQLKTSTPTINPNNSYNLKSITTIMLNNTTLMDKHSDVINTINSVFILTVLNNTFNQLKVNAFLKDVIQKLIIITTVTIYTQRQIESKKDR